LPSKCAAFDTLFSTSAQNLGVFEEFLVREQTSGLRLPLRELPPTKALVLGSV
jgi:hypothetical protein